jgi:hypothetical protein
VATKPVRYRALVGMNLPHKGKEVRVEAGQLIPAGVNVPKWMIDQGHVEKEK